MSAVGGGGHEACVTGGLIIDPSGQSAERTPHLAFAVDRQVEDECLLERVKGEGRRG